MVGIVLRFFIIFQKLFMYGLTIGGQRLIGALMTGITLTLAGCGGGGGSVDSTTTGTTTASGSETAPIGVPVAMNDYLPLPVGAVLDYNITDNAGNFLGSGLRQVVADPSGAPNRVKLVTVDLGELDTTMMVIQPDGVYSDNSVDPGLPKTTSAAIGMMRDYAFPAYAIGEVRKVSRSGSWDEDVDGDTVPEQFAIETTQVFRGFEKVAVPWGTVTAAHFSNTNRLTLTMSSDGSKQGAFATEEAYLAQHIGPVKLLRHAEDFTGNLLYPDETWSISYFTLGNRILDNKGAMRIVLDLPHNAVVYDPVHDQYYASLGAQSSDHPNTIATIDAQTGAVRYSAQIGSNPNKLAISANGQFLYVGLDGTNQVAKLAVPDMSEIYRITFGSDPLYGAMTTAGSLAVSPIDADVFAVALRNSSVAGIAVYNGPTAPPRVTTDFNTRDNLITFGADSNSLYAYNSRSSEFGLRRLNVTSSGLDIVTMVFTDAGYFQQSIAYTDGEIVLGGRLYAGDTLATNATLMTAASVCRAVGAANKIACVPNSRPVALSVFDSSTLTQIGQVDGNVGINDISNFYSGAAGQIAVSLHNSLNGQVQLQLINHQAFN